MHKETQRPKKIQKNPRRIIRHAITLIEMIVVMILIATITGALAYNYRESLNEGKAFKTKEGIARIESIITIYMAENPQDTSISDWEQVIRSSALVKDPDSFLRDGWGYPYQIEVSTDDHGELKISVRSNEYDRYRQKKGIKILK